MVGAVVGEVSGVLGGDEVGFAGQRRVPGSREMTPTCRSGRAHAGGQGRLPGAEHLRGRAVPLETIMQLLIRDAAALAYGDPPS
jgi:hypothetical protein